MVGNLTFGKKGYEHVRQQMEDTAVRGQELMDFFLQAIDRDTDAFNRVMAALGLPKASDEEKRARDRAIQGAYQEATLVPFAVLEKSLAASELALRVARNGNRNSLSDAGAAGLSARAAAEGAYYNVLINIKEIADAAFNKEMAEKANALLQQIDKITQDIQGIMSKELAG